MTPKKRSDGTSAKRPPDLEPPKDANPTGRALPWSIGKGPEFVNVTPCKRTADRPQNPGARTAERRPARPSVAGVALLMLAAFSALYLLEHVVAAAAGWPAAATLLAFLAAVLVVSNALTAGTKGGRS